MPSSGPNAHLPVEDSQDVLRRNMRKIFFSMHRSEERNHQNKIRLKYKNESSKEKLKGLRVELREKENICTYMNKIEWS